MPVIRTCTQCSQKNRVTAGHLADTGRCGACKAELAPIAEPLAADPALFDEITQNAKVPVLVDFWAAWCGPCRAISPVFEKLSDVVENTGVEFYKVDVDSQREISQQVGIKAVSIALMVVISRSH